MRRDTSIQQIGAVMTNPKIGAACFHFRPSVVLLLAVMAVGLLAPATLWAANPTARGVYGYLENDQTYVVVGVNDPDDFDHLVIANLLIPAGSILPGNPTADPPIEPIPAQDISIVQVWDVVDPDDPLTWEALIVLDVNRDDLGVMNLTRMKVYLQDGDDILDARELTGSDALTLEVHGGSGNDTIYGGDADDELKGDSGDDIIYGGKGSDEIDGGSGNDILNGGDDDDTITGGPGNDLVRGDRGSDTLSGGGGWDVVDYATDIGPGAITVNLPEGSATDGWGDDDELSNFSAIRGKDTADTLIGHRDASTTIVGGGGDDTIIGGIRADYLVGDGGDDFIEGHGGSDVIIGGPGNDTIFGFVHPNTAPFDNDVDDADTISGDGTADWVSYVDPDTGVRPDGPDGLEDRPWAWPPIGAEPVVSPEFWGRLFPPAPPGVEDPDNPGHPLQPGTVLFQNLSIGNDAIKGGSGGDLIYGCGGADRINGDDPGDQRAGDDVIFGDYDYDLDDDGYFEFGVQLPNDSVMSWGDRIWGGPGADRIWGGPGDDVIAGGADAIEGGKPIPGGPGDVISGNAGNDYLYGDDAALDSDGFVIITSTPTYLTGSANDTVDYTAATAGIGSQSAPLRLGSKVNAVAGRGSDGDGGTDTLYGIENLIGTFYDDFIQGSDDNLPTTASSNRSVRDINGRPVMSIGDVVFVPSGLNVLYTPPTGFDNILIGGFGNDTIYGGMGVDAIIGDYPPGYLGVMSQLWDPAVMTAEAAAAMFEGDDILYGDIGDGAVGDNDYISGCGGDDEIHGDGGDDVIRGGTGADILHGDAGVDTLDYSEFGTQLSAVSPVRVNLSNVVVDGQPADSATDGGSETPSGGTIPPAVDTIENGRANPRNRFEIVFGSEVVALGGTGQVDTPPLPAPDGDVLVGHESLPTVIYGLRGNDTLIGGGYVDSVNKDKDMPLPLVYGGYTLFSGDDYLHGGPGDDVIMPGTGNDNVFGGEGGEINGDMVSYENLTAPDPVTKRLGVVVSLFDTHPQDTRIAGIDRILGCENLTGSPFDDDLTGDALPNWIFGGAGDDLIRGGGDEDLVVNNQKVIREDYLVGGDGNDTAIYVSGNPALVSVDLALGLAANDGEGGSDRLWEIEDARTVNPPLVVSAGPDLTVSMGGSVVINASVTGGPQPYSYMWEPADGLDDPSTPLVGDGSTLLQPTASPTRTTTYKLTVTDADGRQALDFVTIAVAEALVVSAGPDRTITLGQSTQLEGQATGGVPPYTYVWMPTDGLSRADIARPMASPNHDITYTLTVTDGLGRSASDVVEVRVTTSFSVSAGADVSILPGGTALLNVTVNGGTPPFSYHWTPSTGLSADDIPNPSARPAATTAYTVRVTDATGREASDTVIVTVTSASGGDSPDGGSDGSSGGGQRTPRTSPPDKDGETQQVLPVGCGNGLGLAVAMNALVLLVFRRRQGA